MGSAADHSNDAVYCVEFDLSATEPSILWISIDPPMSTGMPRWHDKRYSYVSIWWVTQIYYGNDHSKLYVSIFVMLMNNAFINCCAKIIKCPRGCLWLVKSNEQKKNIPDIPIQCWRAVGFAWDAVNTRYCTRIQQRWCSGFDFHQFQVAQYKLSPKVRLVTQN